MENIEKRFFNKKIEIRKNRDGNSIIEGYAIVFDSLSEDLGGFYEKIEKNAINNNIIKKSDIKLLFNHNENSGVLARSKYGDGSLGLSIDDVGLRFTTTLPNTTLANDVAEMISRGDIDGCSFAFTIADGGDKWEKLPDGTYLRTIIAIDQLYDVSVVVTPAYADTSVSMRALYDLNKKINEKNEKLENYYKILIKKYLN